MSAPHGGPSAVLWDADRRLAERTEGPGAFAVALQPGIHALVATARESGQEVRTSRPHTVLVAE